eukprot:6685848-Ditylum_brightwellii.AAC.1
MASLFQASLEIFCLLLFLLPSQNRFQGAGDINRSLNANITESVDHEIDFIADVDSQQNQWSTSQLNSTATLDHTIPKENMVYSNNLPAKCNQVTRAW